ncbi:MAG: glycosyltransferase family 2 protein [Rhodoferax sp.]|uniref:glycosyltransferase n=1 Tax=Rhodoferax sp. TaxID=50421 RepID=UPI00260BA3F5|nr:glycosyltransferase [Rhodoferax sp.]MDD2881491.1 glycosyltransferase family 2 protein [Rhodoferax sp.]
MNIYGFMIVKDEADILAQTILSLIKFGSFKKIFIYDNGSKDATLQTAQQFSSNQVVVSQLLEQFTDNLKYENVYRQVGLLQDGDWFAILDADEIYQEPLLPVVLNAELEQANFIETRSAQFYFTDDNKNHEFKPDIAAAEQRPHYLINYGEPRIFKYNSKTKLTADQIKKKAHPLVVSSKLFLIHHFQFRSASQTQRRLDIRLANNVHSKNWGHINSANWQDYMVCARYLHRYDGNLREGLPAGANLYKIKNNAAYTMANLLWLRKHGYLTPDQMEFFDASRLQRLIRKLW